MKNFLYFSEDECKELINYAEDLKNWWRRDEKSIKYYRVKFEPPLFFKNKIIEYCYEVLNLKIDVVNVGVIKYVTGDKFSIHTDRHPTEFNKDFMFNINVLLNKSFSGGDFILNNLVSNKDVGIIYHYSSSIPHGVTEVTNGVRYLALFYVRERDVIENHIKKSII